jgi:hypothetical protein
MIPEKRQDGMSERGHVKLSRKAYAPLEAGGDPFWNEKRVFSKWEAWEYLIQAAAYADHKRVIGGGIVVIPRGHTPPLALSYLAEAWGWGEKRVRNFLKLLVEMDRIRAVSGAPAGTVYLILNYDYYQSTGAEKGTLEGTAGALPGQAEGTPGAPSISSKAGKQESNTDRASPASWMWDLWQAEFSGDHPGLSLTDRRREKLKAFWSECLRARDDPRSDFAGMLAGIRQHRFWGDKPDTWKPEICMGNAERREAIAAGGSRRTSELRLLPGQALQ